MASFSNFCNICYKIDNESLKDISQVNIKHLNDILITFVGHADIINYNVIDLCQLCCEELTRIDKFREMCLSNLIQIRQRYINMKLELQDDNACAVKNTLQQFVYEEVLRKSSLEKSPVSISTDCHGIIKSPEYVHKDCLVFNRQVKNLRLATNECDINGACSEVSGINSVSECDESRVAVTNEEDNKNVPDSNDDNKSDTSLIEFIKEEYDLESERENSDSENSILKNDENESDEHANLDVKMSVVYNSGGSVGSGIASTKKELSVKPENSASKSLELQAMEDKFSDGPNVAFEFVNVCTIVKMEESGNRNITSDDAKLEMKLGNRDSNSTRTSSSLTRQACTHNGANPYKCTVCNKTFKHSGNLIVHERIHSGDRPYKCTVCNKTFTQSSQLTTHKRIHSGAMPYKCILCNKTFKQAGTLTSHARTHSGDRPYKCTVCNKTFTQSSSLTTHERIHSGAIPYKCSVCYKTFTQAANLTVHERIHSGDRPYICTVCNKSFADPSVLNKHKRIHSGIRPYKCTVCDKTFTRSSNLINHERIHSGDKPYTCIICNKTFARSYNLTVHARTHSGDRPY